MKSLGFGEKGHRIRRAYPWLYLDADTSRLDPWSPLYVALKFIPGVRLRVFAPALIPNFSVSFRILTCFPRHPRAYPFRARATGACLLINSGTRARGLVVEGANV